MTIASLKTRLQQETAYLPATDRPRVDQALQAAIQAHATQVRSDGAPYVTHPIAVGLILAEWRADAETISAGLLHDTLEDTNLSLETIRTQFGSTIASLVEGVTKFTAADFTPETQLDRKVETLRRLFEVMRSDLRVAIIKLADRLHNVRTMGTLPRDRRAGFARETLAMYAKLAYHLGMNDLRREFSNRCLPYAAPREAAELLLLREQALKKGAVIRSEMEARLRAHDVEGSLVALQLHPRSLNSLHQERQLSGGIKQAFTIFAIAKDRDACYALLKLAHTEYRPLSAEFHDHIAAPTESAYQSLQTMVLGPGQELVPIRIRTAAMDERERLGVLLDCFRPQPGAPPEFSWLQRSASLDQATRESSEAFFQAVQSDIFQERVSVVVDGRDVHLPRRSTILDALYARHGRDAGRTQSVRVNGKDARLGDAVADDDVILATLDVQPQVKFSWLGYVETSFSRTLITAALKARGEREKIDLGRRLLQKELDYEHRGVIGDLPRLRLHSAAQHFHQEHFERVLALVGEGALLPRDVAFQLFPPARPKAASRHAKATTHPFRVHVSGVTLRQEDVLSNLSVLTKLCDVAVKKTDLRFKPQSHLYDLYLHGHAPDRRRFAEFLSLLDRQGGVSRITTLISYQQKFLLAASLIAAFLVVVLDVLLLPQYARLLPELPVLPSVLLHVLPLLPILGVNAYVLRLLRHYVVRMRTDRWFVGVAFLLNIAGLLSILLQSLLTNRLPQSLLPFLAVFTCSMLYLAFRFFQTEALFTAADRPTERFIDAVAWRRLQRRKLAGYCIRLGAVTIWGLEPIYIRYTPANAVDPFLRTALLSVGVLIPFSLMFVARYLIRGGGRLALQLPYERFFLLLIIGQSGLMYFKNASLLYTSGTNMLLFSNFAPVIGLLIAATFWRREIPYLRQPRHMFWIFVLAVTSGVGGSLLLLNSLVSATPTLLGDLLAMVAVFFDVLLTVGQIEYIKRFPRTDGILLNLHIFSALLLFTAPGMYLLYVLGVPLLRGATTLGLLLSVGIGLFVGFGQLLNYEAFKRIDGYLAFMMFNLSVLLTFVLEVFTIRAFQPTALLLLSAGLIVGASVGAEVINSHCQRRQT